MSDDSDPPRKFYKLKPTEFERVNSVPTSESPVENSGVAADTAAAPVAGAIDVRELARQGAAGMPLLSGNTPRTQANEVHAVLQENLDRANAAGLNDLAPLPKKRSRRKRDYWLMMVPGTLFFGFFAAMGPGNPLPFVYGIGGLVIFNIGLWWTMWHIMEDY